MISNIHINNTKIQFTDEVEQVLIIRNISGNLLNLFRRFSAHTRAVRAVLPTELDGLSIEKIYGAPVLMSGLSSLILSNSQMKSLNVHSKACLEGLMRLHKKTPSTPVLFLAGSLPAPSLLHINKISLLNLIIRFENNPLNLLARFCPSLSPLPHIPGSLIYRKSASNTSFPEPYPFSALPPPKLS